jgi:hypothetical protein
MGILRNAIILGAVAVAMPNPPSSEQPGGAVPPTTSSFAYVAAAAETFADLRTFCERRPGVCQTAGHLAVSMEAKAKYSAKLIYEWANDASAEEPRSTLLPPDMANADPIATGTTDGSLPRMASQSTLTLEDLLPEWKSPPKPKKG